MNEAALQQKEQQLLWEIEQQQQISHAIAHARNETEQIFNVSSPLCVINKDFTVVRVNNTFCTLFNLNKENVTGTPCYSIWNSNICDTTCCPLKQVMDTRQHFYTEGKKSVAGQCEKTCMISASPFYNSEGAVSGIVENIADITSRKKIEQELAANQTLLEQQNIQLAEKNSALRELMHQIEREKEFIRENIQSNVHLVIEPLVDQLRNSSNDMSAEIINCLDRNLNDLTSPFGKTLSVLSQKEISICTMIKNGLTSKDIAQLLHLSEKTIETHRKNIRKKLGITHQQQNLQSVLHSITNC